MKATTLAKEINVDKSTMSKIETGQYPCLKVETLLKIGANLEISFSEL